MEETFKTRLWWSHLRQVAGKLSERRSRIVFEQLPRPQSYVDVLHVSFTISIGKNSKTCHALIRNSSTRDGYHAAPPGYNRRL
jgi:hypothetical protein